MSQIAIIGGVVLVMCSSSLAAALMMGGEETTSTTGPTGPSGSAEVSFVIPTDETSLNECYASRYTDLRLAYDTNNTGLGAHWTTHGTGEGRDHSCTITDAEAQCYLDRYPDAKAYAGTDLKKATKTLLRNRYRL
ncbi:hypothetical protein OLOG_00217 [Ostreococcus lucimarinus virus OlV4]|nr:hypothetical protein OLOG_00217 [Ostreococcus lucimarinus virus OlV4]